MKMDCFGYDPKTKKCKILKEDVCRTRKCSFYKTKEQYMADKEKYPVVKKSEG